MYTSGTRLVKISQDHWKAFYKKKQPTMADVVLDGDFTRLPKLYTHVSRSTHNPKGYKAEGWFVQVNGKDRYLIIEAAPIYDRNGNITHVLETINDLTESKSLEEQLMHAQKMESIGHLAGGIAHEFNNILAVILGYGQVMRKEFAPDSTTRHDIDQILTAAERAAVLTKGLLAFSRKQHVSLRNLNVNVLLHDTLKSFSRIMGDDIIIKESMDDVPLIIYGDHSLLTQVLMNLMSNARDAMPNGGELDVSAKRTVLYQLYLTPFCSVPPGKYAQISLTDNGKGMDEETIKQIFEPFYTTKDVDKGTGLGLSVVYGIVSQHNGYICVSSTPGQSTTFDLYFPLIVQHVSNMSAMLLPDSLPGGDETILLADDDPVLLMLFSDILSEMGYHVITAADGLDAIEKFAEKQEDIKLVILDAQMPKKSGLQVYKEIKLIKPECKVLFVSGYNEEQFQGEMTLEKDSELLAKPFAPDDLAARVRKILDAVKELSHDKRRPS
jgi:two-component system cell cycle sensor histidine kinase/response regulator CckA